MPNTFNLLTTLVLIIIAVVYLNNAFLQVDYAGRKGCHDPYSDENGTIQNCTLSNVDLQHINNTEKSYSVSLTSISLTIPILAVIVLIAAFIYIKKVKP